MEQRLQYSLVDTPLRIELERQHWRTPPPQSQDGSLTLVEGLQVYQPLDLHHVLEPTLLIYRSSPAPLRVRQSLDAYDLLNHPGVWETTWIPFTADEPDDPFTGTFIDAATGLIGSWNRQDFSHLYDDGSSLTGYLTEVADELQALN